MYKKIVHHPAKSCFFSSICQTTDCPRQAHEESRDKIRAYQKSYYVKNKERLKQYAKNYQNANKERARRYYRKNKGALRNHNRDWHAKHPGYQKNYYRKNKTYLLNYQRRWRAARDSAANHRREKNQRLAQLYRGNSQKWKAAFIKIYGENPKCQVCGKVLNWNGGKHRVNFDHRHGRGLVIRRTPSNWYRPKKFTRKNWKIWKQEHFGILCSRCNRSLPTGKKSRRRFVLGALRYWEES